MKALIKFALIAYAVTTSQHLSFAQGWLGTGVSDELKAVTAAGASTVKVGIGVTTPTARLHTNGSLIFQGLTNSDTSNRFLVQSSNGTVYYRNLSSIGWLLTGNASTDTTVNFLGTTDSRGLWLRTNNVNRMLLDRNGRIHINNTGYSFVNALLTVSGGKFFAGYTQSQLSATDMDDITDIFSSQGLAENYAADMYLRGFHGVIIDKAGGSSYTSASASSYSNGANPENGCFAVRHRTSNTVFRTDMIIRYNGNVGIGTTTPTEKLTVDGNIDPSTDASFTCGTSINRWSDVWSTNSFNQTSDKRLKTNITTLEYGLNEVLKLKPVTYNWIKDDLGNKKIGFLAQDLKDVLPEVVVGSEETKYGVRYTEIIPVLVNAIQEQNKIIKSLEEKIDALQRNTTTQPSIKNNNPVIPNESPETPLLFQNIPNPTNESTQIKFYIPNNSTNANISIFDLTGKLIKSFNINEFGHSSIILTHMDLTRGTYLYTLIVNSVEIDTKKMILL